MENEVKEPVPKLNFMSPEEYLEMERASEQKHEYYKGEVFAMSGAGWEHNVIASNLSRLLADYLHGKGCRLFGSDFRIHIPGASLFTYPDFSIVCGEYLSGIMYADNLTSPSVIIEILSPSTKDYDRGSKFMLYRSIQSLHEYLLIDSGTVTVELYTKQNDHSWLLTEFREPGESVFLQNIGYTLKLSEIYEDLKFND